MRSGSPTSSRGEAAPLHGPRILAQVVGVTLRDPDPQERKKLHRLGDGFAIATLLVTDGETLEVAAGPEQRQALLGPFVAVNEPA
jgi:hypothetical protein